MEAFHALAAFAAATGLSLVHLLAGRIRFIGFIPRSRWLSFAGGVSVAYVFLHLLPELAARERAMSAWLRDAGMVGGKLVYLVGLFGLAVFYGLERLASRSRRQQSHQGERGTSTGVFWLHIGSFALYNALIGYLLLHMEDPSTTRRVLFFLAMAMHFLVNDFALRDHHKELYGRIGRWVLAGSTLTGWGVGMLTESAETVVTLLMALLAGGVILNILKEEVPDERESNFGALALGMALYSALLLTL